MNNSSQFKKKKKHKYEKTPEKTQPANDENRGLVTVIVGGEK